MTYPRMDSSRLLPLQMIARGLAGDPSYLDGSPYSPEVRVGLLALLAPKARAAAPEAPPVDLAEPDTLLDLGRKASALYRELEGIDADDATDAIQIVKAKAGLLEKLIGLAERANNAHQVAEFKQIVLGILDDMDADHRNEFMERLAKFA